MNNTYEPVRNWILNALLGYKNKQALVVFGPHRSGKTLACKLFADNFNKSETYFLDNYERRATSSMFNAFLDKKKVIFCEELQQTSKIYPLIISEHLEIHKMLEYPKIIKNELNVICTVTGEPNFITPEEPFIFVEPLTFIHILRDVTSRLKTHS